MLNEIVYSVRLEKSKTFAAAMAGLHGSAHKHADERARKGGAKND